MGRSTSVLVVLAACLCIGMPGLAQEFALKVGLESPDFPDLDTDLVIEGDTGNTFEFTGNMIVGSSGLPGPEGPQGWSWGVRNENVEILSTTVEGTVSDTVDNGGLVNNGFVVSQVIDPDRNDGKQGSVQAVVLALLLPVTLPANTDQITAKNTYRAEVGDAPVLARIGFEEGLRGAGEPVANNVTYLNQTQIPTLGQVEFTIQPPQPEEETNCSDGIDNDQDGDVDCEDSDCEGDPACPGEETDCSDGVDNDQDGDVDCDDADCAEDPICQTTGESGIVLAADTDGSTSEGGVNKITLDVGTTFEMIASIIPTGDPFEEGAQGWSISVAHDPALLEIQNDTFPTIDGTDAGGAFADGFQTTEIVDPADNGGTGGFVSAVVLSLTQPIFLDPAQEQSIVRAQYEVLAAGVSEIEFLDGLVGGGQPVPNVVTIAGDTVPPDSFVALEVTGEGEVEPKSDFIRGDANDDGKVNIADPIWIISELVRGGPATACQSAADANDDGDVDLSDSMYLINWRFMGGPAPTAPFPACGQDPSTDSLDCLEGSVTGCPDA